MALFSSGGKGENVQAVSAEYDTCLAACQQRNIGHRERGEATEHCPSICSGL